MGLKGGMASAKQLFLGGLVSVPGQDALQVGNNILLGIVYGT